MIFYIVRLVFYFYVKLRKNIKPNFVEKKTLFTGFTRKTYQFFLNIGKGIYTIMKLYILRISAVTYLLLSLNKTICRNETAYNMKTSNKLRAIKNNFDK